MKDNHLLAGNFDILWCSNTLKQGWGEYSQVVQEEFSQVVQGDYSQVVQGEGKYSQVFQGDY